MPNSIEMNMELYEQLTLEMVPGDVYDLNLSLGPMFEMLVEAEEPFTLQVGTKTSSLFAGGGEIGPRGPAGDSGTLVVTSAESLGLYRAVTITGNYCEPDINSLSNYAGVTTVAVASGVETSLLRTGYLSEPTWNWTVNAPIFVGASGTLTQVVSSVPMRRIGWAFSATEINLDPQPTIGA